MTTATDYLLGAAGLALGARLWRAGPQAARLWGLALATTGLAALVGGSLHGFGPRLSAAARAAGWQLIFQALGLTAFLLVAGSARACLRQPLRSALTLGAGLAFGAYVLWTVGRGTFGAALLFCVAALVTVFALETAALVRGAPGAVAIASGLGLSIAAAGLQRAGLGFGPAFNHNDLFHVLEIAALWLMARGALRRPDRD